MPRLLYRFLLHLHPHPFRQRYAEEMLWIFDQSSNAAERGVLIIDGFASLARQWLVRPANWKQAGVPVPVVRSADGVPLFHMIESAAPGSVALVNGMLLSMVVFAVLAIVIAHGGPSGTVQLPRVVVVPDNVEPEAIPVTDPPDLGPHREFVLPDAPDTIAPPKTTGAKRVVSSERSEILVAAPPIRLLPVPLVQTRKRPAVPGSPAPPPQTKRQLRPVTPVPLPFDEVSVPEAESSVDATTQAESLLTLLDENEDGVISTGESTEAGALVRDILARADRNQDQVITFAELRDAMSAGRKR